MSEWQPSWTYDSQSGFFITPDECGGFLIASVNASPRFCFFANTLEEARTKVIRALDFYERAKRAAKANK